ncbi:MAG: peptide synthase [Candidatus Wallbacteria bacterium HGW-Wallbacteria-1]|jgi:acyl-CoA synthetase (AMP-forming)/AMP-acid ligase II|uniref:Peptide synthase n=1 Tax=Candidatus Wallbacteria bacterium HGW-Wallbacteria-1 TaxID=2013854 RepID=A0A2N1PUB1_9BACT|nr:MAG: peptide synthase [Candidatus Wallbacteria bacterium HGW-Wallbacteria-1]
MTSSEHLCGFDSNFTNVAAYIPFRSREMGDRISVAFPETRDRLGRVAWTHLTFSQLDDLTARYAAGLRGAGFGQGMRTLLMVRPSLEFIALAFALFRIGAVPILIDPGMGVMNLLGCIREVEPQALVAIPEVLAFRKLWPGPFASIDIEVSVGARWWWREGICTDSFLSGEPDFSIARTSPEDMAAILFTTGSTGPAKGVVYRHRMFEAQVQQLMNFYGIDSNDVEMPAFPLFALFSPALGITCVIPEMDPTRPAQVDPAKIVEAVRAFGVTNTFGSPTIWRRVTEHCIRKKIRLPSLKRVLMAGAPVPVDLLGRFSEILSPGAMTHTPYGATETLPSTNATGEMILEPQNLLRHRNGGGTLVGVPLDGMEVKIISISDEPISNWTDVKVLQQGSIGEIAVTGPVTTREYFRREQDNLKSKIMDGERIWHRMGDVGYFDEAGLLWFCGRKAHRVVTSEKTLFTIPCETIANRHPLVFRSALVGTGVAGRQHPVMIVEPRSGKYPKNRREADVLKSEVLDLLAGDPITSAIDRVMIHPQFPTDIRHNAKIFREKLSLWATHKQSLRGFLYPGF